MCAFLSSCWTRVRVCACVRVCAHTGVPLRACVSACVCFCVSLCTGLCVHVVDACSTRVCVCVCAHMRLCICGAESALGTPCCRESAGRGQA